MIELVEVKTAELVDLALDWCVAKADNLAVKLVRGGRYGEPESLWFVASMLGGWKYSPSTDWSQGGPLIEKHVTALNQTGTHTWWAHCEDRLGMGNTALIAACRAIVASVLGDTVSVPKELV